MYATIFKAPTAMIILVKVFGAIPAGRGSSARAEVNKSVVLGKK